MPACSCHFRAQKAVEPHQLRSAESGTREFSEQLDVTAPMDEWDISGIRGRTTAVITAYKPDGALVSVVDSAKVQCEHVIVVDNTPHGLRSAEDLLETQPGLTVLRSEGNVGLAAALNRGISTSSSSDFIFLLDQDSVLESMTVARLAVHLDGDPCCAIAAPAPWDANTGRYLDPRTFARPTVATMRVVITSAMLLRRVAYDQTQGMREDFFVDCVDQDFCLQVRRAGWTIVQDKSILLPHALGATRWHGFGLLKFRATHHPTWRLYWVARNGVILSREYFRFDPRWSLTNLVILTYWLVAIILFEPPRWSRVKVLIRGMLDGIHHRRDSRYLPGPAGE